MDHLRHATIPLPGLSCGPSEAPHVERAVVGLDGVTAAYLNAATRALHVSFDGSAVDVHAIANALVRAGYHPGAPIEVVER
jgi:copper chaperone CopZ